MRIRLPPDFPRRICRRTGPASVNGVMDVRFVASEQPRELPDLYREHVARLGRVAYLIVGGAHEAEDVVAVVFGRIARRGELAGVESPAAYLTRAVVNEAISQRRRRR